MSHSEAPRRKAPLLEQQVGEETLLFDEQSHRAYCLNATAAAVWRQIDGERDARAIAGLAFAAQHAEDSRDLVEMTLAELRRDGLVQADTKESPVWPEMAGMATDGRGPAELSRRAMLTRMGAGAALLLPVVAAIVAPTPAQAYSGCVDCSFSSEDAARSRQRAAQRRAAESSTSQ